MRKGWIIALTISILSCSLIEESQTGVSMTEQDIELNFSVQYPDSVLCTKVHLDGKELAWTGDEAASIIFGVAGTNNYTNPIINSVSPGCFSGTLSIPEGMSLEHLEGIIIPAENKGNFRGNHSSDKRRLRMYVDSLQTQNRAGEFNPVHCPFFAPLTFDELTPKGNGRYSIPAKTLKSASDLIRFNIYGKHPAQRSEEVLKSIKIIGSDRLSGSAEWNTETQPTSLSSNGASWVQVSLNEQITIADKNSQSGIKVFASVILGGSRTINEIQITTDKAVYTKTISKRLSKKNVNKFTVIPVSISMASGFTREAINTYPENNIGWTVRAPEEAGFNKSLTAEITSFVEGTDLTSMKIIAGGEEIYTYGDDTFISYLASCRKSVLSMLYGKYVENGTVDLNTTVGDMISKYGMKDDVQGLLESEKQATILDLITSRSGIYHDASNAGDEEDKPARGTYAHGTHYLYNNWDFNFAGAALERLVKGSYSGKEIYSIIGKDLAEPIAMADWSLSKQKYGGTWKVSLDGTLPPSYYPAYHIYLSTRDMARIGYLMLRKGKWNGKEVISEDWIKTTTTPFSTFKEVHPSGSGYFSYGYMWWIFDSSYYKSRPALEGAYMARGAGGQFICIIPKLDTIIAWKTDTTNDKSTSLSQFLKVVTKISDAYKDKL